MKNKVFFLFLVILMISKNISFSQPPQKIESFIETIEGVQFKMIKVPNKNYYISETEVTQELWEAIMGKNANNSFHKNCPQCPVEMVNWKIVTGDFIRNIMRKTGKAYRLPLMSEWEYAAKGGEDYKYAGSNDLDEVAWYFRNADNMTHPVKQKKPNGYGLYDMLGNVQEWCQDPYETKAGRKCIKGGSFVYTLKGSYRIETKICYGIESLDLPAQFEGIRLCLTE